MKIVTWNCNGAYRNNYKRVFDVFDPDIMIIQECEEPDKLQNVIDGGYNIFWVGDDKNKGLSIISKNYLKIKKLSVDEGKVSYILLVQVNDDFKIAAFWAMNSKDDKKQRYIGQVWTGLNEYLDELDDKTIVIGDLIGM